MLPPPCRFCHPNIDNVFEAGSPQDGDKMEDDTPAPLPILRTSRTVRVSAGANSHRRRAPSRQPRGRAAGGVGDGRHPLRLRTAELGGWTQALRRLLGVRVVRQRSVPGVYAHPSVSKRARVVERRAESISRVVHSSAGSDVRLPCLYVALVHDAPTPTHPVWPFSSLIGCRMYPEYCDD